MSIMSTQAGEHWRDVRLLLHRCLAPCETRHNVRDQFPGSDPRVSRTISHAINPIALPIPRPYRMYTGPPCPALISWENCTVHPPNAPRIAHRTPITIPMIGPSSLESPAIGTSVTRKLLWIIRPTQAWG